MEFEPSEVKRDAFSPAWDQYNTVNVAIKESLGMTFTFNHYDRGRKGPWLGIRVS